jgi:signal transduction histidine kinase
MADGPDTVWIGAYGSGLYCCQAGQVKKLPSDTGMPVDDLRSMAIDSDSNFWFGTGHGLFRVERNEIISYRSFGRNDGLPSLEFAYGFRNATMRANDGHLWFATYRGALEITPKNFRKNAPQLPVLIEDIRVGDSLLTPTCNHKFTLPPQPGPLEIHYTLPQLTTPEQIRFRYRLVGLSDNWIESQNTRSAIFPHLAPGNYRFEVAATLLTEPWESAATVLHFTVRPSWWETAWFYWSSIIMSAVALVWLTWFIGRRRVQARIRLLEQQHLVERERIRIARDIHDEMGANLTRISLASQLAKLDLPETSSKHIDQIAEAAQEAVESLDEIVWAINPRCDTLPSLIEYLSQYAVNFFTTAGISYELDVPCELPLYVLTAEMRHHLFLAVKEAFTNVVKHAKASKVYFQIKMEKYTVFIIIKDNGKGFNSGGKKTGANGLNNMAERLHEMGGECNVKTHINDGTSVVFRLPLHAVDR